MKRVCCLFAASLLLAACGPADPAVIRMAELKEAAVPQAGLPCFSSEERILLDREPNEWSVALPEKVVVAGERIYLLGYSGDMRLAYVSEYDHEGRAVRMIGRRGRGPGEYARAQDFVVGPDGDCRILLVDRGEAMLYHYGPGGTFLGKASPAGTDPVSPYYLAALPSGELLVGTTLWDKSAWKDFRVVVCDTLLQARRGMIPNPHNLDPNFAFSNVGICDTGDGFQYIVPMEDYVHRFDRAGNDIGSVRIDFGPAAVTDDIRADVEPHLDEMDGKSFLFNAAYLDDAWLFGSVRENGKPRSIAVDRAAGVRYATEEVYGLFFGIWDGRAVWLKDTEDGWQLTLCTLRR
ncbi:MAG: 6-bladed beta-propeller [Bacteroidales bacterium]|nr:6-bladed beta-propeller [Bacteroidales bacterium]